MPDQQPESDFERGSVKEFLGIGCLFFAGIIFCLLWMDRTTGLPFNMPSSWYKSKLILFFFALSSLPLSYILMRKPEKVRHSTSETPPQIPPFGTFRFYTRQGCHLCDDALEMINKYENVLPEIEIIDIDSDPALAEKFTTCVPVVEIDGKVRFRGKVNEILFKRLLEGAARAQKPISTGMVVPLRLPSK